MVIHEGLLQAESDEVARASGPDASSAPPTGGLTRYTPERRLSRTSGWQRTKRLGPRPGRPYDISDRRERWPGFRRDKSGDDMPRLSAFFRLLFEVCGQHHASASCGGASERGDIPLPSTFSFLSCRLMASDAPSGIWRRERKRWQTSSPTPPRTTRWTHAPGNGRWC